jgi:hypothetical protein
MADWIPLRQDKVALVNTMLTSVAKECSGVDLVIVQDRHEETEKLGFLINQLIPFKRVPFEKLVVVQLAKILSLLRDRKFHCRVRNSPTDPILGQLIPVHALTPCFFTIEFHVIRLMI